MGTKKRIVRDSVIVGGLTRAVGSFYRRMHTSLAGFLVTSYDALAAGFSSSVIVGFLRESVRKMRRMTGLRQKGARAAENSFLIGRLTDLGHRILAAPVSSLGVFSASFGLYSGIIFLLKVYAFSEKHTFAELIVSGVLIVLSFFFFAGRGTVAEAIADSSILTFVFHEILGLRRFYADSVPQKEGGTNVLFALGMVFGLLAVVVPPVRILAVIGLIVLAVLILSHPESGVLLLALLLPFLPTMVLIGLTLFTGFSLAVKVALGKRVLTFTPVDATVLVFALFVLCSGFVSRDVASSVPPMLVYLVAVSSYFIVKNLLCTPGIIRHAIRVSLFSMTIVSVLGIVEHYTGSALGSGWVDTERFAYISGRAVSVFENPNVLGEYLILLLPIAVVLIFVSNHANAVLTAIAATLLGGACLLFTWSRGAWIGLFVALVLICILSDHRVFTAALLASPLALLLVFVSGSPVLSRLSFGDSSSLYRANIWRGVSDMLKNSVLSGIGIGESVFVDSYLPNAVGGAEVAYHAHSLYLQIVCAMGIFGLIAFFVFLLLFTMRHLSYARVGTDRKGKALCLAMFVGIAAFLTQGLAEFVFYNYRVTLFFWMLVGLSVSYADYLQGRERDAIAPYLMG